MWASYQQDASVGGWVSFGLQRMWHCGGGELLPRKSPLAEKESSPHRYSAVDPDLSIVLAFMTSYFLQNVQVELLHQSFKPAEKNRLAL